MKRANMAPVYCALYPALAEIARSHGYALAIHGSLGRDFDLICVPWILEPSEPVNVVKEMTTRFAIKQVGAMEVKEHGRETYTIAFSFGECFADLSFTPRNPGA